MIKSILIFIPLLLLFSCKKEQLIFDSVANEDHVLPLLLNLDGRDCAFDAQSGILKFSIDKNTLENFAPMVKFQSFSALTFEDIQLKNNAINSLGQLKLNTPYKLVVLSNGETNNFTVQFTDMPIVQIVAPSAIGNSTKTLSRLIFNHPDQGVSPQINWIGVEHRGASSLAYPKKSYGFEVYASKSNDVTLSNSYFGYKPNFKWILNAQYIDPSRARNNASFSIWQSIPGNHEHIGIKTNYVEVYVNNKAQGLYAFTESYTPQFLNLENESVFYEGTDNSLITKFRALPEKNPNSTFWGDWEQKFFEAPRRIYWDDFEAMSQLIVDGSDAKFRNDIDQYLDFENLIDYFLFVNVCKATDNVGKNWNFLKRSSTSKFTIVPWDFDGTWGRSPFGVQQVATGIVTNALFERLRETNPEQFNARLKVRWQQLRGSVFSETNLTDVIGSIMDEIAAYQIIDFENTLWNTNLNLKIEQSFMEGWISQRLVYLDNYLGE